MMGLVSEFCEPCEYRFNCRANPASNNTEKWDKIVASGNRVCFTSKLSDKEVLKCLCMRIDPNGRQRERIGGFNVIPASGNILRDMIYNKTFVKLYREIHKI